MRKSAILMMILVVCLFTNACGETDDSLYGEIKGAVYENHVLGIGCALDGWRYCTREEITENRQKSVNRLSKEYMQEMLSTPNDLMRAESPSGETVSINALHMGTDETVFYTELGMRLTFEILLESMKEKLENMGYTGVELSVEEISLKNQTLDCLILEISMNGIHACSIQAGFIRDNYMVRIGSGADDLETAKEQLMNFYMLQ